MVRHYDPATHPPLVCVGCGKTPSEIGYSTFTHDEDGEPIREANGELTYADDNDYVWQEEGTLNTSNGHFLCDLDYIAAGSPSSPYGWKAP